MHRGGRHWTEPASGLSSDCFFDNSRTSLDHFPLFFRREVGKDRILCIGVASDLVSASVQLFDSFGKKLGAFFVVDILLLIVFIAVFCFWFSFFSVSFSAFLSLLAFDIIACQLGVGLC